jgi:hypothetical protein
MFAFTYATKPGERGPLQLELAEERPERIISLIVFNALIIPALAPLALSACVSDGATALLRRNLLIWSRRDDPAVRGIKLTTSWCTTCSGV